MGFAAEFVEGGKDDYASIERDYASVVWKPISGNLEKYLSRFNAPLLFLSSLNLLEERFWSERKANSGVQTYQVNRGSF